MTKILNWYPLHDVGGGLNRYGESLADLAYPSTGGTPFIQVAENLFFCINSGSTGVRYTIYERDGDGVMNVFANHFLTPNPLYSAQIYGAQYAYGRIAMVHAASGDFNANMRITIWEINFTTGAASPVIADVLLGIDWQDIISGMNSSTGSGVYAFGAIPDPVGGAWVTCQYQDDTTVPDVVAYLPQALILVAHVNAIGSVDSDPSINSLHIGEPEVTGRTPGSNRRASRILLSAVGFGSNGATFDDVLMAGVAARFNFSPFYQGIGVVRFSLSEGVSYSSIDTNSGSDVALPSTPSFEVGAPSGNAFPFLNLVAEIGTPATSEPHPWVGALEDGSLVRITDREISLGQEPKYNPVGQTRTVRYVEEITAQQTHQEYWYSIAQDNGFTPDDAGVEDFVFFATGTASWPAAGAALGSSFTLNSITDFYTWSETEGGVTPPYLYEGIRSFTYGGGALEDGSALTLDYDVGARFEEAYNWIRSERLIWLGDRTALLYTTDPPSSAWEGDLPADWDYNFDGSEVLGFLLLVEFDPLGEELEPPCGFHAIATTNRFGYAVRATDDAQEWNAIEVTLDVAYDSAYSDDNSLWVIVGDNFDSGNDDLVSASNDGGETFFPITPPSGLQHLRRVAWGGDRFVAVGTKNGFNTGIGAVYSTDGLTWNYASVSATGFPSIRSMIWAPSMEMFLVADGTNIFYSPDGITWGSQAMGNAVWGLGANDTTVVASVGSTIQTATTSPTSWTTTLASGSLGLYVEIAWSPTLGLWAGAAWDQIWSSPDAANWTVHSPASMTGLEYIAWSESLQLFIVIGDGGEVWTSPDLSVWTNQGGKVAPSEASVPLGITSFTIGPDPCHGPCDEGPWIGFIGIGIPC